MTRLCGLGVVTALVAMHNLAILGRMNWTSVGTFAYVATFYGLGSWLMLRTFFLESQRLHLGTLFLVADVPVLLLAIHLTGGTSSWLFLLLAARCTDQIFFGVRRVIWFSHLLVGSYFLYALVVAATQGGVDWKIEGAKLAILYAFNWYYAVTARTVDSVRRRFRRSNLRKRERDDRVGTISYAIGIRAAGFVDVLESFRRTPLDHQQKEYLRILAESSRSLVHLANVLNDSENQMGGLELEKGRFAPAELVSEVAFLVRPLAESKGLDLRVDVSGVETLLAMGDSGKLRHALLGLAHNATRFTEQGCVELRAWRVHPGRFGFEVKDSGVGISFHVKRRLLAPFRRADGSPSHRTRGLGTGFGISRRLIESMGGVLELDTAPGLGTTVRFTLDLPDAASLSAVAQLAHVVE